MPMPPSASDWTRLKRLVRAGRAGLDIDVVGNTDLQSPQKPISSARDGFRPDQDRYGGIGRTRREASRWTDAILLNMLISLPFLKYQEHIGHLVEH